MRRMMDFPEKAPFRFAEIRARHRKNTDLA